MGIRRYILCDAGDPQFSILIHFDDLTNGIFVAEIFSCRSLGQHHAVLIAEHGGRISAQQGESKEAEEIAIGNEHLFFVERTIVIRKQIVVRHNPNGLLYRSVEVVHQGPGIWTTKIWYRRHLGRKGAHYPIDVLPVGMKIIEAEFMHDE